MIHPRDLGRTLALLLASALCLGVGATVAREATAAEQRIGIVDLQKVLKSTASGKAAQKKFDDLRRKKQKALEAADADIKKRQKELLEGKAAIEDEIEKLGGKPAPDTLKARAASFQEKARKFEADLLEYERDRQASADELIKKESELLKPIEDAIRLKVETVARERGLAIVLSRAVAVYTDPALDITDEVIRRVDGK